MILKKTPRLDKNIVFYHKPTVKSTLNDVILNKQILTVLYDIIIKQKKNVEIIKGSEQMLEKISEKISERALNYHAKNKINLDQGKKVDPMLKFIFGSKWYLFSYAQLQKRYKLSNSAYAIRNIRLKEGINIFMQGGDADDDDDKFLKFLNSIVNRFGDVISHITSNKRLYLLFGVLMGTSVYLYKNRKAVKKSLNEVMQEIEKNVLLLKDLLIKVNNYIIHLI